MELFLKPMAQLLSALMMMAAAVYPQSDSKPTMDSIAAVMRGDPGAMLRAGDEGAMQMIPALRLHLHDSDDQYRRNGGGSWGPRSAAQMALAKLGEQEQQLTLACELHYGNLVEQGEAFYKIGYVGGWFAVTELGPFLGESAKNTQETLPGRTGRELLGTRQRLAMSQLRSLLQASAVAPEALKNQTPSEEAKALLGYIGSHSKELVKLRPTGENIIDSAQYCEGYLRSLPDRPSGPQH